MSTTGIGKLACLTNSIINWEIPSFHLLPRDENTHVWSPVFIYYHRYTSYAIPHNKLFLKTPKKSLGLKITSSDVQYNQFKPVQIGLTDEINTIVINRCDGVWIEHDSGKRYIKVENVINDDVIRLALNKLSSNEINLRFFCIASGNGQQQRVNASIQREEECALASSSGSTSATNKEENWNCRLCTLINTADASNCEACNLPKPSEFKFKRSSEKLVSAAGNPATPATNLPICIICVSKERDVVFQPCGHLITCSDCADFRMTYCPLCRKDIKNKLKTFIN